MAIHRALRRWVAPFRSMHRQRENYFGTEELEDLHALDKKRIPPQDAQKVRPARPQRVKARGVTFPPAQPRAVRTALFPGGVR